MKRMMVLVFTLICVLGVVGCGQQGQQTPADQMQNNAEPSVPAFSFAEDNAIYAEGDPGVKTSGFVNTTKVDMDAANVVEVAKNECTVQWDSYAVHFDTAEGIWRVVFYTEGMLLGGDQSVYLDRDGRTVLIVYGE